MHISTRSARRAAAATSALALAAGGALLISPAQAATSAELNYTCQVGGNGQPFKGQHTVADTAPYGGDVPVSGTITVPDSLRAFLYNGGNGVNSVDGTTKVYGMAAGILPITVNETVPKQSVPASGDWVINASGVIDLTQYGSPAPGTAISVDLQDRKNQDNTEASDLDATLQNYDKNGAAMGPAQDIPCELADGQTLTVGTVTVVKADTDTAPTLKYNKKKGTLTPKTTVSPANSHLTPDGKVKMVLKKNGKVVSGATKTLSDAGVASLPAVKVKKGSSYKLIAKYLGTSNFNTSGGTAAKKF